MKINKIITLSSAILASTSFAQAAADHLVFEAKGKANGKHVVLLAGDEEYRSEEAMPMLGQILANNGFKCTVLFSMDSDGKFVDPTNQKEPLTFSLARFSRCYCDGAALQETGMTKTSINSMLLLSAECLS